jgi:hypothetical protein
MHTASPPLIQVSRTGSRQVFTLTEAVPHSALDRTDWVIAIFAIVAILVRDAAHVAAGGRTSFGSATLPRSSSGPPFFARGLRCGGAERGSFPAPSSGSSIARPGSNILPFYAVHLGGTAAAFYATRRAGFSERGWLVSLSVLGIAVLVSRVFLPEATNVNAAHAVPHGWGFLGGSRGAFALGASAIVAATCLLGRMLGRVVARTKPRKSSLRTSPPRE